MRKLNIGSGEKGIEGYDNLDACRGDSAFPLMFQGFEIQDETYDVVRASHILEHFHHRITKDVLTEWVRVLKVGGELKIAVPNFCMIAWLYTSGVPNHDYIGWVMGGGVDENDVHKAMFDDQYLTQCMTEVGIVKIKPWISEVWDCANYAISCNLCGVKQ